MIKNQIQKGEHIYSMFGLAYLGIGIMIMKVLLEKKSYST